jgi:hypothetical protein
MAFLPIFAKNLTHGTSPSPKESCYMGRVGGRWGGKGRAGLTGGGKGREESSPFTV